VPPPVIPRNGWNWPQPRTLRFRLEDIAFEYHSAV
jgi:hypothetical protein